MLTNKPFSTYPPFNRTPLLVPAIYDDAVSYLEKLQHLYGMIAEVIKEINNSVSSESLEALRVYLESSIKESKDYSDMRNNALKAELITIIDGVIAGDVVAFDPSTGFVKPVSQSLSHVYNDLGYWRATWDEIDTTRNAMSYDEWDDLTEEFSVKYIELLFALRFGLTEEPRAQTLPQDD